MPQALVPDTAFERSLWEQGIEIVAGVDEVGRGCLAGPVVAAACVLPAGIDDIPGVRDSKSLSPKRREELVRTIRERASAVSVAAASRREIDRLNIRGATALAMRRALRRLGLWDHAIIDGPLMKEFADEPCTGLIDGDALCLSVSCASILAKEARDHLMRRLARRYPEYGWERNVGYGTTEHLAALSACGPTPHHRRTFKPVRDLLERSQPVGEAAE